MKGLTPFVATKKNSSDTLDFASKCQCCERVRSKEVNIKYRSRVTAALHAFDARVISSH